MAHRAKMAGSAVPISIFVASDRLHPMFAIETLLLTSLGYNVICDMIERDQLSVRRDPVSWTPFASMDDQWVSYDDCKSIRAKTRLVNEHVLAGGMIRSIDSDDFQGICGEGKFPLLTAINADLR